MMFKDLFKLIATATTFIQRTTYFLCYVLVKAESENVIKLVQTLYLHTANSVTCDQNSVSCTNQIKIVSQSTRVGSSEFLMIKFM